jgi:glycosyltransferase involved in cell wall biosynthesis
VVDDGSNDGTGDIAARYGDQIRYVRQSNRGAPTARNLGLSLGIGEFVAFLDADDLWHPEKESDLRHRGRLGTSNDLQFSLLILFCSVARVGG